MKKKKVQLGKDVFVDKPKACDRCGNDLVKGANWLNFPFKKLHMVLCHVCLDGLKLGFYRDTRRELKELE